MYVRFVKLRVKPGMEIAYDRFYRSEVAPTLLRQPGCLFAHVVHDEEDPASLISLTFWRSASDASAYQEGGTYAALLDRHRPFLDDSSEWKMVLTEDMTLSYQPVPAQPEVEAFDVAAASEYVAPDEQSFARMYLRIVSGRMHPEKEDEFLRLYRDDVLPVLRETDGCRYVYLAVGRDVGEVLSVTIWESREHAAAYEASGRYEELLSRVRPALSSLAQWRMTLDPESRSQTATSEDVTVRGFTLPGDETAG